MSTIKDINVGLTIHPSHFSRLTIQEARERTLFLAYTADKTQRQQKHENRKRQVFEQILKTKPRKLLLVKSDS